jgi:hypothetical protein
VKWFDKYSAWWNDRSVDKIHYFLFVLKMYTFHIIISIW